ncbi:MAG TPA: radical SAM family heme chaperone HemW [Terriglobales bacterium]|nr:radical SAM family heme chaperone HemW [Terriglobales bacterium]
MPLGLYISVPFCRTKCTYCNFASDVFSKAVFQAYVDRLCRDLEQAPATAQAMGGHFERNVDTIYLGGGTPTVLDISQLQQIFTAISHNFQVVADAEITVECAPGTLTPAVIDALQGFGVNRISVGAQSFFDKEVASVGRLHKQDTILQDISRLRAAGIGDINIDLIAGLPHQTVQSWEFSLEQTIATKVPHVSVYMLEVDEDSRLGRELIAGGTKYHAHFVPDEDLTADLYLTGCEQLEKAGVQQYEISNFARSGHESRHNLKYWTRQPYLGFGVDAHSMLNIGRGSSNSAGSPHRVLAVRFSTPDSLQGYLGGTQTSRTSVDEHAALEETFFLGLRLTRGVDRKRVSDEFGEQAVAGIRTVIAEMVEVGLMEQRGNMVRLTARGRLLSNEVFERFISAPVA